MNVVYKLQTYVLFICRLQARAEELVLAKNVVEDLEEDDKDKNKDTIPVVDNFNEE